MKKLKSVKQKQCLILWEGLKYVAEFKDIQLTQLIDQQKVAKRMAKQLKLIFLCNTDIFMYKAVRVIL